MAGDRSRRAFTGQTLIHCAGGNMQRHDLSDLGQAIRETGALTVELVCNPNDLRQSGPARILTWSLNAGLRNWTIGQLGDRVEVRCRTTATTTNGLRPHLLSPPGTLTGERQHLVFVRTDEAHRLYVDGVCVAEEVVPGTLDNWDPGYPVTIGDEADGGFAWQGVVERAQITNAGIDAAAVGRRFQAWRTTPARSE